MSIKQQFINDMFNGYVECAIWADLLDEHGEHTDDPYDVDDLTLNAREVVNQIVTQFYDAYENDIRATGADGAQTGHDLYLTSMSHGAGFWDRGYGEVGDRLSKASKPYAINMIWVDGNGKVEIDN